MGITKEDIGKKISVEEYNRKCREAVLRYKDKWDELTERMGYWVDLEHPYITFENQYIETLWWILKEFYKKDLLFESISIQPYSPAAGTGLSSHELNQPGTYKEVKDTSCVAMFKAVKNEESAFLFEKLRMQKIRKSFFWPGQLHPGRFPPILGLLWGQILNMCWFKLSILIPIYPLFVVLAKALLGKYFKPEDENVDFAAYQPASKILPWKIMSSFPGTEIENCRYEQLIPSEAGSLEKIRGITPDADPFPDSYGRFCYN